jgi:hypothetical protein
LLPRGVGAAGVSAPKLLKPSELIFGFLRPGAWQAPAPQHPGYSAPMPAPYARHSILSPAGSLSPGQGAAFQQQFQQQLQQVRSPACHLCDDWSCTHVSLLDDPVIALVCRMVCDSRVSAAGWLLRARRPGRITAGCLAICGLHRRSGSAARPAAAGVLPRIASCVARLVSTAWLHSVSVSLEWPAFTHHAKGSCALCHHVPSELYNTLTFRAGAAAPGHAAAHGSPGAGDAGGAAAVRAGGFWLRRPCGADAPPPRRFRHPARHVHRRWGPPGGTCCCFVDWTAWSARQAYVDVTCGFCRLRVCSAVAPQQRPLQAQAAASARTLQATGRMPRWRRGRCSCCASASCPGSWRCSTRSSCHR